MVIAFTLQETEHRVFVLAYQTRVDDLLSNFWTRPIFRIVREYPAQKSELRAHQMARNCGVPGSLRTKSELSSHQMAHPGQLRTKNPS